MGTIIPRKRKGGSTVYTALIDMAKLHRHSPELQKHRRAMWEEHEELAAEWMGVRNEIDTLEALS